MPGLAGDFLVGDLAQQLQLLLAPTFVSRIEKGDLQLDSLKPHIANRTIHQRRYLAICRSAKERNFLLGPMPMVRIGVEYSEASTPPANAGKGIASLPLISSSVTLPKSASSSGVHVE